MSVMRGFIPNVAAQCANPFCRAPVLAFEHDVLATGVTRLDGLLAVWVLLAHYLHCRRCGCRLGPPVALG